MDKKQYTFSSLAVDAVSVLLASMLSFVVCDMLSIRWSYIPFIIVGAFFLLKLFYISCLCCVKYIIGVVTLPRSAGLNKGNSLATTDESEIQKKRIELFCHQYQNAQNQYNLEKEKAQNVKLNAVLKYTHDTFLRLSLDEMEVFQICECIRYFVTNGEALTQTEIRIKRRSQITQASLKNFAWNIAYQYNISGDATTRFVIATFGEWFSNSTFDTIRKNLRSTIGRHKIEIDENILK